MMMTANDKLQEARNRLERSLNYNGEGDIIRTESDLDDDDGDLDGEHDESPDQVEHALMSRIDRTTGFLKRPGVYVAYEDLMRYPAEIRAMHITERLYRRVARAFTLPKSSANADETNQIHIPPRRQSHGSLVQGVKLSSNNFIDACSSWLHRASFINMTLMLILIYLVFIVFFNLVLYGLIVASYNFLDFECCNGFDYNDPSLRRNFEVAFELSWTTFSTVVSFSVVSSSKGLLPNVMHSQQHYV